MTRSSDAATGLFMASFLTRPLPALYGRADELGALDAALTAASASRGQLVLVAGEAGIGKTSLVETIATAAGNAGGIVLTGHCYDLEAAAPYEPWIELLRSYRSARVDGLPDLPPGLGNAELLDVLAGPDALFEQLAGFLGELASDRPVVLVLEDLHWSDQASLDLLRSVARRLPAWRLLVVATFRDDELTPRQPLHRVLPLLVREARPLRVDLRRLGKDAIRRLVVERYGLAPPDETRLVDHLQRYAEGNPFFVEELLRTLEHERLVQPAGEGQGWRVADLSRVPVPSLVRQLIDERVARAGAPVQHLLQVAAVIGVVLPLDLWQAAAEVDDEAFADAVDLARHANLIDETPDRSALQFSHALVRETLYAGVALPRRRTWHRRIGELLAAETNADPEAVAHHLLQGGDSRAAAWLIQAGRRAERRDASWDAVARYEQALPLLERDGAAEALGWLHADLAESYRYIDPAKAAAHLDSAERVAQGMAQPTLALAVRWLRTRLRGFLGQGVIDDLRDCIAALEALPPQERARLQQMGGINIPSRGLLAQWIAFHGKYDEAIAHAEAVLAAPPANSAVGKNELGGAHIALGLAWAGLGQPARARVHFAAAREQFAAIGSAFMVASTLKWEWIEVAMPYAADDLELCRGILDAYTRTMWGLTSFAVFRGAEPLSQIFGAALLAGRWGEVRESALAYLNVPAWRVAALAALANLERRQGRPAAAWARIRSGIPGGSETAPGNLYFVDTLHLQRLAAALALDEGELDVALAWIEAVERGLEWSGRVLDRPAALLLRARYHLARGERVVAAACAREALQRTESPRQPLGRQAAHRFLGRHAVDAGDFPAAREHLESAMAIVEVCALPYERALILVEQAALALAQDQRDAATPLLGEARTILTPLGAAPVLERVAELETRSLAAERDDTTEPLPAGLSPRETEVLRLVARGLSYADVGDQLYISPRTVARHLQSIYNKLGVDSRAEAAAFAFAHGLA
jgi:DNA-binding CsgD family transcriptional regulator/tetratricopeptide (TPR) repeat protein